MLLYARCGRKFALYVQLSKSLGVKPVFAINACKGEIVLDMPWMEIILTGPKRLRHEVNVNNSTEETDGTQDSERFERAARAAKN